MKKKVVSLVLMFSMLTCIIAGCGNKDTANSGGTTKKAEDENVQKSESVTLTDDGNETLDISVWLYKDDYKEYDSYSDNPVVAFLNNKFNCKLDFQQPPMGSEKEQFSLMLGTGSYTDVMEITFSTEGHRCF